MALRTASPSTLSSIQSTAGERDTVRAPRIVPDSKAAFGRSQQRKSVQKQGSLDIRLYDQRGFWEEHNPGEWERIRIDAWGATIALDHPGASVDPVASGLQLSRGRQPHSPLLVIALIVLIIQLVSGRRVVD